MVTVMRFQNNLVTTERLLAAIFGIVGIHGLMVCVFFRAPQIRGEALRNFQYAHVEMLPLKPTNTCTWLKLICHCNQVIFSSLNEHPPLLWHYRGFSIIFRISLEGRGQYCPFYKQLCTVKCEVSGRPYAVALRAKQWFWRSHTIWKHGC